MYANLLVCIVVLVLSGLLLGQLRISKRIFQYVTSLLKTPGTANFDRWRCRLAGFILLCPLVPAILEGGELYVASQSQTFAGPSREVHAFAEILAYVRVVVDPLPLAGWLGLLAYSVLRRPHLGKTRLILTILGYWIGGHLVSRILLHRFTASSILIDSAFVVAVGLLFALVTCLFWLVVRGTRSQLIYADEIADAEGLSVRDMMLGISVIGALIWLIQSLAPMVLTHAIPAEATPALLFLQLSMLAITITAMLVMAFLLKTTLGILASAVLLGLLQTGSLLLMFRLRELPENLEEAGFIEHFSATEMIIQNIIWLAVTLCLLLLLHFAWRRLGLSVSVSATK